MSKAIELVRPIRSEYATDDDWLYACSAAVREYNHNMMLSIDRTFARQSFTAPSGTPDKLTAAERSTRDLLTIHDYLAERPALLERYKREGISVLLEL